MSSQNSIATVELSEQERYFDKICDASHNYPQTAPSSRRSTKARKAVATTWNREAARIFHPRPENACLKIFETCDCMTPCNCQSLSGDVKTMEDLLLRLQPNKKAPKMRYVSLLSKSSKDQVRCPIKMFKYLCTYQRIPASFLSCLYSFRRSHSAQEWCNLPQFNDDNTLLSSDDDILPLDRMGLSGREIRYSFVLRSVESSTSVPNRSWGVRQLAVYHSFDIENGQSLWLTCKGNSLNEELFQEALSENKCLQSSVLESVPQAFSSSLEVLTMLIDWCDDDWIFYINELFDGIKPLVDKARTPAIKDESALTKDVKIITGLAESPSKRLSHMTSLESRTTRSQSNEKGDPWGDLNDRVKRLERLEVFSFDELQKLQQGLETIQEALLVLKLNNQVIRQIREHYQCLMTQYRLPALKGIKKGCEESFIQYCRHSRNIEANIDAHQAQLNALLLLVKESKEMYNTILQYKTIQINKIYAESAHLSTRNMENIANKTKQETSSMHIITFVTLIFLPGTFMASFFQSGILEWPQVNAKAPWRLNKEIFSLFFGLSATITIVTIVVWMIILFMLRRPHSERVKHAS
ncbi:uncharacterized protein FMAN_05470 [Fusarium mangiferae]|uniref:CorA-like transporter domain-containing protein n=1 Tax=Fusarium mangiferae TaxID=192010 RepID=A0A1L7SPF9_FUSMA|nr:uncharacterized protein FMAN_05470 [Fusarium mangiferae]CVK87589.1 uncharacterized protein FMAN_05470 [Fusarium mangiferae]